MSRKTHWLSTAGFALSLVAAQTLADQLTLQNGDRLTGEVVRKGDETLTFRTSYAGEIQVAWPEVAGLKTDAPVAVMLVDNTSMQATLDSPEPGKVVLKSGEIIETAPIDLGKVAYINPPPHLSGKGVELSGRANVAITATRGNTDNERTYVDAELVARTRSNRYTIGAIINRAQEEGEDTASNATAYSKYDHFLSEKRYLYGNVTLTEDEFRDLNLRTALSIGLGHQFRESQSINLALEGGLAYVNEDFIVAEDESYGAARWALNYDQQLFGGKSQFFHNHEGLLNLEDTGDVIVRSRTGLRFPLLENLESSLQVNADWDNSPPAGTESTDLTYLLNLGYKW